jgi:hypothetical protein
VLSLQAVRQKELTAQQLSLAFTAKEEELMQMKEFVLDKQRKQSQQATSKQFFD